MYFLCLHHCPLSICTFGSINVDAVSHRHRFPIFVTVRFPIVTVAAMSKRGGKREQGFGRGGDQGAHPSPPTILEGPHL